MTIHQNYIYILQSYYNFRLHLINVAIIEVDCNMDDENMVNVAADIEEVRDVILALMPRLHTTLVTRECEGCTIYHPSQTQHQCLDPVDEETTKIRIDQCLAKCTGELIRILNKIYCVYLLYLVDKMWCNEIIMYICVHIVISK